MHLQIFEFPLSAAVPCVWLKRCCLLLCVGKNQGRVNQSLSVFATYFRSKTSVLPELYLCNFFFPESLKKISRKYLWSVRPVIHTCKLIRLFPCLTATKKEGQARHQVPFSPLLGDCDSYKCLLTHTVGKEYRLFPFYITFGIPEVILKCVLMSKRSPKGNPHRTGVLKGYLVASAVHRSGSSCNPAAPRREWGSTVALPVRWAEWSSFSLRCANLR